MRSITPQIVPHLNSTRSYAHTDYLQGTMLHVQSPLAYQTALAVSGLAVVMCLSLLTLSTSK